jgi:hypothetical protein
MDPEKLIEQFIAADDKESFYQSLTTEEQLIDALAKKFLAINQVLENYVRELEKELSKATRQINDFFGQMSQSKLSKITPKK